MNIHKLLLLACLGFTTNILAQDLPVTNGLQRYYLANDLAAKLKENEAVSSWISHTSDNPLTTPQSFRSPIFIPKESTAVGNSAAVRFERPQPIVGQTITPEETAVLMLPELMLVGDEPWREMTLLIACSKYEGMLFSTDNRDGNPTLFIGTNTIGFHDTTSQAYLSFNPAAHPFFEVAGILAVTISRDKDDLISVSAYFNGELILGPFRQEPREGVGSMLPSPGIVFNYAPAETLPENLRFSGFGLSQGLNADIYAAALYDRALTSEEIKKVSDTLAQKLEL